MTGRFLMLAAVILALVAMVATACPAATIEHTLRFSERDLNIDTTAGFDVITLAGCDLTRGLGRPQLPVLPLTLSLPPGARIVSVEVLRAESTELIGVFRPRPAQHPRILPAPGIDFPLPPPVAPDPGVYESDDTFPSRLVELTAEGTSGTAVLAGALVYPMQFMPGRGKLRFFHTITLGVNYETGPAPRQIQTRALGEVTRTLASNAVATVPLTAIAEPPETFLDAGDYEHIILSGDVAFDDALEPLAAWKSKKGVPSRIVDLTWIDETYPGVDSQERMRNFMADANATWGSVWFLMIGDSDCVPTRRAYAMTSEAGAHPDEDAIACDLYFSDLDGTWDADGDGIYGELGDAVDLYPDVFVGRAPMNSAEDVEAFVAKLLEYERAEAGNHHLDMLMAAEVLWSDPFTDSGIALSMIDRESVPPRFDPIEKLYETLGNETVESVKSALNSGQGHFLHSGHAWYNSMGCADGMLYRWDIFDLTNDAGQPLVYSIGCWPAAFDLDSDCIAERFLQSPSGGAVAFIGNSRYGWASPGNPGYGYSERFMQQFYRALFVDRLRNAGAALASAKAALIPLSQAENVYRWHQYELNLLGDPEMPVWTGDPAELSVTMPDSVVPGPSVLAVTVRTAGGPVEGALVCVTNGGDVYERAVTSSDGSVSLSIDTILPDSLDVTVTAADCRPFERELPVTFSGAFVRATGYTIADLTGGNGDGLPGPGETVDVTLDLSNLGTAAADEVLLSMSSEDPLVTVISGALAYGTLAPGQTAAGPGSFEVAIGGNCADGHVTLLDLNAASATSGTEWAESIGLTVRAPVLVPSSYSIDDRGIGGDADGLAEPGETVEVTVNIENRGHAVAAAPTVALLTDTSLANVTPGHVSLADLEVDGSAVAVFEMVLSTACPPTGVLALGVETETAEGFSFSDTLFITIGEGTFEHDFEDGESGWALEGTSGSWCLTDNRSHSGSFSWYSGSPGTWQYSNGVDCRLISPEFVMGVDVELSFWCWYELPIYHEDGFYIELLSSDGTPVDTLDFIGSGGALDVLGSIGNDWLRYSYPVSGEAGDTLRVRFRFTSDESDVSEGVYVDDVSLSSASAPDDTGNSDSDEQVGSLLTLHQNLPNPFSPSTVIRFTTRAHADIELAVYNVQGRLIRTLASGYRRAGDHEVPWDGRDQFGADVAAGVYLYRLTIGEEEDTRKMILVR